MLQIPIYTLLNLLYGFFAIATACAIVYYRKNFSFYNGIAILLAAQGTIACTAGAMTLSHAHLVYSLYYVSRSILPIFLLTFSEYVLKTGYPIRIKIVSLAGTWILGIMSFFQMDMHEGTFNTASDLFVILTIATIITSIVIKLFSTKDILLFRQLVIFMIMLIILLTQEVMIKTTDLSFKVYIPGLSAFLLAHTVIFIVTSGGFGTMKDALPKLMYIFLLSSILTGSLKLIYSDIHTVHLIALFIISVLTLSIYYMIGEVSRNPKGIRSTF